MAELSTAQKATLRAAILATPALSALTNDYQALAAALNANANPVVKAWLTSVSPEMMDDAPDYTTFDAISAGKRDSWAFLIARPRDFTRNKTRQWIADVWGTVSANSNSEKILLAGTENISVAEQIFGGSSKSTGTVTGIDRVWTGDIGVNEINNILYP